MKLNAKQILFMQEAMGVELVSMLMEDRHCNMRQAMDMYYNSDTFKRLSNPATELYYQSTDYVYDYLRNELVTGKIR